MLYSLNKYSCINKIMYISHVELCFKEINKIVSYSIKMF